MFSKGLFLDGQVKYIHWFGETFHPACVRLAFYLDCKTKYKLQHKTLIEAITNPVELLADHKRNVCRADVTFNQNAPSGSALGLEWKVAHKICMSHQGLAVDWVCVCVSVRFFSMCLRAPGRAANGLLSEARRCSLKCSHIQRIDLCCDCIGNAIQP